MDGVFNQSNIFCWNSKLKKKKQAITLETGVRNVKRESSPKVYEAEWWEGGCFHTTQISEIYLNIFIDLFKLL